MQRKLSFLGVVSLLGACDNISDLPALQKDSGVARDGGASVDAGQDASEPVSGPLVLNPGAACADDTECEGPAAVCQKELAGFGGMAITFPGGYCTATCTTQEECAVGSECGVKKLIDTIEPFLMMSGTTIPPGVLDMIPSQCLDLCSTSTACREDYECQTLIEASGAGAQIPIPSQFLSRYCLPVIATPPVNMDAGSALDASQPAPDAGQAPDDAAVNRDAAATSDASQADAAAPSDASPQN